MSTEENATGRAAVYTGGNPITTRASALLAWLSTLGLFVWLVFDDSLSWWQKALCVLFAVPVAVVALAFWGQAGAETADFVQLRDFGRPAVAEVIDMAVSDGGGSPWAVLDVRVSGDAIPPFEGRFSCAPEPEMRVGAQLRAVADPSDNLFTLRPVRGVG